MRRFEYCGPACLPNLCEPPSLSFVRPVILVDASHLRSKYDVSQTLLPPCWAIGFMIANVNEDRTNWMKTLRCLKHAFPSISEQQKYPFVVVSDAQSLCIKTVSRQLRNKLCHFRFHANVKQIFGDLCPTYVMVSAKWHSLQYNNQVLNSMKQFKPSPSENIENITLVGVVCSNSKWTTLERTLPPQFGIVTWNTSESAIHMFISACDLPWMYAMENMINITLTRK